MKKYRMGLFALLLLLAGSCQSLNAQDQLPLVPYPQELELGNGAYVPASGLTLRISGMEGPTARIMAEQLEEIYRDRFTADLETDGEKPHIWIGIPAEDTELMELAIKKKLVPGEELGEEGYLLKIEKKQIYITANGPAGAFYGVQTLCQLFHGTPDPMKVPTLVIRDWPSIPFRCVMDDISRGPIPTPEYLKEQVRRYAGMKLNNMSFYI